MIKAVGHFVLLEAKKLEKVTESGVIIPEMVRHTDQGHADSGRVVDIGSTAWKDPGLGGEPWAAIGDTVFYTRYAGKIITDPKTEEKFLMLNDTDIMGVLVSE